MIKDSLKDVFFLVKSFMKKLIILLKKHRSVSQIRIRNYVIRMHYVIVALRKTRSN